MNHPAQMTKFEIQYSVKRLSAHMRKWNKHIFAVAIGVLMYCITTKHIGLLYSRGLDKHGVNVIYSYADSSFGIKRPIGCRYVMMNGAIVRSKTAQHSVMSDSTCSAEAIEAALAGNDIIVFRFLISQIGFKMDVIGFYRLLPATTTDPELPPRQTTSEQPLKTVTRRPPYLTFQDTFGTRHYYQWIPLK